MWVSREVGGGAEEVAGLGYAAHAVDGALAFDDDLTPSNPNPGPRAAVVRKG